MICFVVIQALASVDDRQAMVIGGRSPSGSEFRDAICARFTAGQTLSMGRFESKW